jgi:thioredoxin reductase (NADPH)
MAIEEHHDVAIIGGGAAGINCALECFDIQLDTVVFEAADHPGGQLTEITHSIRNVAAGRFPDGVSFRNALEQSAAILGSRLVTGQPVTALDLSAHRFEAEGRVVRADAIVMATGTSRQELAAAPDGAYGGDVTYQITADVAVGFAGRDVVVIGGGDSATLDALELARRGSTVTLVHRSPALTARDDIVEKVRAEPGIRDLPGWQLDALDGDDQLREVTLRRDDGETCRLAAGGLVVKIARVPRTQLLHGQLAVDHTGAVLVDRELRTSRDGVFAAGDVVSDAYQRVAAALGQGSLAARSVLRFLQARR